jgi:hypothetical protein
MKTTRSLAIVVLLHGLRGATFTQEVVDPGLLGGDARPITQDLAKLPSTVRPEDDAVSLRADFDHAANGLIHLFLINATGATVSVPAQDGDLYSKRESKDAQGKWRRCDGHSYSWCGNSYVSVDIPPGKFYSWQQPLDSGKGQKQPVRFRLYQQAPWNLVSNLGTAVIDPEEVERCRLDILGLEQASFEDVLLVATEKIKGGQGASIDPLDSAIRSLARFGSDPRLFDAAKQLLAFHRTFVRLPPDHIIRSQSLNYYLDALELLSHIRIGDGFGNDEAKRTEHTERHWNLLRSELFEKSNPWREDLLSRLVYGEALRLNDYPPGRMKSLLDEIISQPNHPAIRLALQQYGRFADPAAMAGILAKIADDSKYPGGARSTARDAWEDLFPNPYVSLTVMHPANTHDDYYLSTFDPCAVRITNISAQPIQLSGSRAEDLLIVRLSDYSTKADLLSRPTAKSPSRKGAPLTLQPGEVFEVKDVRWWELAAPAEQPPRRPNLRPITCSYPQFMESPCQTESTDRWSRRCELQPDLGGQDQSVCGKAQGASLTLNGAGQGKQVRWQRRW